MIYRISSQIRGKITSDKQTDINEKIYKNIALLNF